MAKNLSDTTSGSDPRDLNYTEDELVLTGTEIKPVKMEPAPSTADKSERSVSFRA